jgi:hypothetical protein
MATKCKPFSIFLTEIFRFERYTEPFFGGATLEMECPLAGVTDWPPVGCISGGLFSLGHQSRIGYHLLSLDFFLLRVVSTRVQVAS